MATETKSKANLAEALSKAQGEFKKVEKSGMNPHLRNQYATLDDIQIHTFPILSKHGLAWVTLPTFNKQGEPLLAYRLLHTSGEQIRGTMKLLIDKQTMQGLGSAITYAQRYSLKAVCGISTGEDDDGNAASNVTGGAKATTRAKPPIDPDPPEEEPQTLTKTKGQQTLELVKHSSDLFKEIGMIDFGERSAFTKQVLGKPTPGTVGEYKTLITALENKKETPNE